MRYRKNWRYRKKPSKTARRPTKKQAEAERNDQIRQLAKKSVATLRAYIDPNSEIRRLDAEVAAEQGRYSEAKAKIEEDCRQRKASRTRALRELTKFADITTNRETLNRQYHAHAPTSQQRTFWTGQPTEQAKQAQAWIDWFWKHTKQLQHEFDAAVATLNFEEDARCAQAIARLPPPPKRPSIPWPILDLIPDAIAIWEKEEGLKAAAARNATEQRTLAESLRFALRKDHACPYCGYELGSTPHADHIYPVSKGGRSTVENMVYICAQCNVRKGNRTVRAFAKDFGFDFELIEARLISLGKDF